MRGTHNPSTSLTNDIRFDAFGQQDFHGGAAPSALPLAWHHTDNYQTDNDSGLMLLGNRYYDSVVGRFISPDPSGDGDNWYAYCDNDPLGEVDPEGLDATPDPTVNPPFSVPDFGPNTTDTYTGETDDNGVPEYHSTVHFDPAPVVSQSSSMAGVSGGILTAVFTSPVGQATTRFVRSADNFLSGGMAERTASASRRGNYGAAAGAFAAGVALTTISLNPEDGGPEAKSGLTTISHWDTPEELALIGRNGLRAGSWVMKGKPNVFKWLLTGKFLQYNLAHSITREVPASTVTREGVDFIQRVLGHYRYMP